MKCKEGQVTVQYRGIEARDCELARSIETEVNGDVGFNMELKKVRFRVGLR